MNYYNVSINAAGKKAIIKYSLVRKNKSTIVLALDSDHARAKAIQILDMDGTHLNVKKCK